VGGELRLDKVHFPEGIPFVLGVATAFSALAFYYTIVPGGFTTQLYVGSFHVHHIYLGIGAVFLSLPLWVKDYRFWSLFFLGLGTVLMLDGAMRTLYGVAGSYP
jgi:hypothetical protein